MDPTSGRLPLFNRAIPQVLTGIGSLGSRSILQSPACCLPWTSTEIATRHHILRTIHTRFCYNPNGSAKERNFYFRTDALEHRGCRQQPAVPKANGVQP